MSKVVERMWCMRLLGRGPHANSSSTGSKTVCRCCSCIVVSIVHYAFLYVQTTWISRSLLSFYYSAWFPLCCVSNGTTILYATCRDWSNIFPVWAARATSLHRLTVQSLYSIRRLWNKPYSRWRSWLRFTAFRLLPPSLLGGEKAPPPIEMHASRF